MVLGWSPFNLVSDSPALHSRWLLLLKIEISCFRGKDLNVIFYQNMPNLYFRGKDLNVIFYQNMPNLYFRGKDLNVTFYQNMAAVTKNRNFFSCQFLLYYKSK
jgi:hypothetical protein